MIVLVHGGAHCSWHWHLLRPLLERLGHETIAPDVPMDDPSAGAGDWARVIEDAIADAGHPDDIVLVGHSLAGLALPIVGSRVRLRRMVFLCANVPMPGRSYEKYLAEHPDAVIIPPLTLDELGRLTVSWEAARELFYGDCDETLARDAYEHLIPSAALVANRERCPLDAWPEVPSSYILCEEDRIIGPSWSRRVSMERLGHPAIELPGGHSPFLAQPERLAKALDHLAKGK
jgi:pimeloyl-ACP methyl ester carboxylesterase